MTVIGANEPLILPLQKIKKVSRIKHGIQKSYLGAWSGILGSAFPRLAYFDCFAGEGAYADEYGGEIPGSPQQALEVAIDFVSNGPERSVMLGFIERDGDTARRLEQRLNPFRQHNAVKIHVFSADAHDLTDHMIEMVHQFGGGRPVPTFFS